MILLKKNWGGVNCPVLSIAEFREYYNKNKPEKVGLLLTVGSVFHGEIYPYLMFLGKDLFILNDSYMQMAEHHCGRIDNIVLGVRLSQNCKGIACYGCTAAAPIVRGLRVYDYKKFQKDLDKMKKLIGEKISMINFTGGDVFLHPNLAEIVEYTRLIFPNIRITFSINGVLLREQTDELWERLNVCGVELWWTLYPIKYKDMEEVAIKIAQMDGIKLFIQGDTSGEEKNSWKLPYTFQKQNIYDWLFCTHHKCGNNVLTMFENTLATCHAMEGVELLLERFLEKRDISQQFIDAYKNFRNSALKINCIESENEIFDYMQRRLSMCDYCALRERKNMEDWLPSKGDFSEWFVEEKD